MRYVRCRKCEKDVEAKKAWRKRELFSKGDGGSLGRVKLMTSLDFYLCDSCVYEIEGRHSDAQGALL